MHYVFTDEKGKGEYFGATQVSLFPAFSDSLTVQFMLKKCRSIHTFTSQPTCINKSARNPIYLLLFPINYFFFHISYITMVASRPGSPYTGGRPSSANSVHTKVEEDLHEFAGIDYYKVSMHNKW